MAREAALQELTQAWGSWDAANLYLDRCQVDTPPDLVEEVWGHVLSRRERVRTVLDFGAGDGRFARAGRFDSYIGYEIDASRIAQAQLPSAARLVNQCAFDHTDMSADLCLGNPPYVRNQDLPDGWRRKAASVVQKRTGVELSGLANAWQYFMLLALASVHDTGLVALVIPFEWVSRPAAAPLRDYLRVKGWHVDVYRHRDSTFGGVLTTASISIIDKSGRSGKWRYFDQEADQRRILASPSGSETGVLAYTSRRRQPSRIKAHRGLSPGTQGVLTLTEQQRLRAGLAIDVDVVPCVTSLRNLSQTEESLGSTTFRRLFRDAGRKCWLIRTDTEASPRLRDYLDSVPAADYQTRTCLDRPVWWQFHMPPVPRVLIAQSFKGATPKVVANTVRARAVGAVGGIHGLRVREVAEFLEYWRGQDLRTALVPYAGGMFKLEINQLNTLLDTFARQQGRVVEGSPA